MKLVNVTPHLLTIFADGGSLVLQPSGIVARCSVTRTVVGDTSELDPTLVSPENARVTILFYSSVFGTLQDLPEPQPGTVYVASMIAAQAAKSLGRSDVVFPGELVRDEKGQPIGCKGLSVP